jgi:hypothetical protein
MELLAVPVGLSYLFSFLLQWQNSSVIFRGMYLQEGEDFFPPTLQLIDIFLYFYPYKTFFHSHEESKFYLLDLPFIID